MSIRAKLFLFFCLTLLVLIGLGTYSLVYYKALEQTERQILTELSEAQRQAHTTHSLSLSLMLGKISYCGDTKRISTIFT